MNLETARLPKVGSKVVVKTMRLLYVGELVGVKPGQPSASRKVDRYPKLCLRNEAMSAAIPERDISKVQRYRKPAARKPAAKPKRRKG